MFVKALRSMYIKGLGESFNFSCDLFCKSGHNVLICLSKLLGQQDKM